MTNFNDIKTAFIEAGWTLDHVSKKDGIETSLYFTRWDRSGSRWKEERVRISDHRLGVTIYGEEQGQNLDADFCLGDYFDDTPAQDFVIMAENEDHREVGARGITPSMDGWGEELAEVQG